MLDPSLVYKMFKEYQSAIATNPAKEASYDTVSKCLIYMETGGTLDLAWSNTFRRLIYEAFKYYYNELDNRIRQALDAGDKELALTIHTERRNVCGLYETLKRTP